MSAFVVTRDIDAADLEGLDRSLKEGDIIYMLEAADLSEAPGMVACTLTPRASICFSVPRSALMEYERTWEQTCYMPHDPTL